MEDLISRQAAIDLINARLSQPCKNHTIEFAQGMEDGYCRIRSDIKSLPSAQPEQRWIPCSERLPEESGRYLVSVLDGVGRRTTVAPYQPRYKAWTMTGRMAYWKVIAWMPLPESYRGANE